MEHKKKCRFFSDAIKAAALVASLAAPPVAATEGQPWPLVLREQMVRLNSVGYRIGLAAAPLCPSTAAGFGLGIDYIEAYDVSDRAAVSQLLGLSNFPQIATVAPGSPADISGIKVGDVLAAVDGIPVAALLAKTDDRSLFADFLEQQLAQTPEGGQIKLKVERVDRAFSVAIAPRRICSAHIVVKTGKGIMAFSDGKNVGVSSKLIAFTANNDELALIVGHEIGHIVNGDDKAHSLADRREMEDRADILGLRLMKCAGYDPNLGLKHWLRRDQADALQWLRSPTHRSGKGRVRLMQKENVTASCPPVAAFEPGERAR